MSSQIPVKHSCKFCNFSTLCNEQLSKHVSNQHKEFKCSICHQRFLNLEDIRAHIKKVHLVKWTCHVCDKSFANEVLYRKHTKLHLNVAFEEPLDEEETRKEKAGPLKEPCENTATSHVQPAETYKCVFCDFTATDLNGFDIHIRSHAIIEVLQCDECKISFDSKALLEEHRSTHKKIIYQCGVCDITSPSKKFIIKHVGSEHSPLKDKKERKTKRSK